MIALGGLGEIGMNCLVLEQDDDIVVIDCGVLFPDGGTPGIDLIMPDFSYLFEHADKVKAILLTHGHEDHIGGLPFLLKKIDAPIYATSFTAALVTERLKEHGLEDIEIPRIVEPGDRIDAGSFTIEYVRSYHSFVDATALAIETPHGVILHSGDFKLEQHPVRGSSVDLDRLSQLGEQGVLLLLSDSTNIERSGFSVSEADVRKRFEPCFSDHEGRIFITLFASHIHRIQQVVDLAREYGRQILLLGRSLITNVAIARNIGVLEAEDALFIDDPRLAEELPANRLVILLTGSQGEGRSALTRVATGEHEALSVHEGDLVIFSSRSIPGNERAVHRVINLLYQSGAKVLYEDVADVHASGHAHKEELRILMEMLRPRCFVPIHGEYRHLALHAELARSVGIPDVAVITDGTVLEVSGDGIEVTQERISCERMYVDGRGQGEVDGPVLRNRRYLANAGLLLATVVLDAKTGELVRNPEISQVGVVEGGERSMAFLEEARKTVASALGAMTPKARTDVEEVEETVRAEMRRVSKRVIGKRPVIIPIILEV